MSIPAHTTHLGFPVHIDELVEQNTLTMRSATHDALLDIQNGVDWTVENLRKENADLQGFLNTAQERIAMLEKPATVTPVPAPPSLDLTPMPEQK
jgi:hypothetical protein